MINDMKKYVKPAVQVFELPEPVQLLQGSYDDGGLGHIPTISGQPDVEKHLA